VLTKQVLQNILEHRNACSTEFQAINETQKKLEESLWTCQKARSYLNYARTNLTTTSLEILASYRKREVLKEVLHTLVAIKKLVSGNNYINIYPLYPIHIIFSSYSAPRMKSSKNCWQITIIQQL